MLAESKQYQTDGTLQTKSKYFGQLYVINAFFPPKSNFFLFFIISISATFYGLKLHINFVNNRLKLQKL